MWLAGCDPGLQGALAFLDTVTGDIEVLDMPTLRLTRNGKLKGEIDAAQLANIFWKKHAGHAFVEIVGAMPANGKPDSSGRRRVQGSSSAFSFGKGYGTLIGVLAAVGVPVTFVSAAKWKKAMDVTAAKDGSLARAKQLMPELADRLTRVKDHGRAEAALISLWGMRTFNNIGKGAQHAAE